MMEVDTPEGNGSNLVPPEIWVKIFALVTQPRNLSKLRPVCKQWQAIIDENFDVKVKINDDQMDVTSIFKFKRVVQCIVSKFLKDNVLLSPVHQIFCDPDILSSLILRGTITKSNFLLIAEQCQNVKELFLTGSLLVGDASLFVTGSNEETSVLSKFMSGITKVVVNGSHIATSNNNNRPVNLYSLLNWQMNKLKTLVVRVNFPDAASEYQFFELLGNFSALESIEFTSRSNFDTLLDRPIEFILPALHTLNVEVWIDERLGAWTQVIGAQSSIKNLKVVTSHDRLDLDDDFIDAIIKNSKTLQSLELRKLNNWFGRVNVQFLSELDNLKSLVLHGNIEHMKRPMLQNLGALPESLDTVVIENFECSRDEFDLVGERVTNLKTRNIAFGPNWV